MIDNIDNIKKLIDYLPSLIIYIVPGYITICIISFIIQRKQSRDKVDFFNYIVCSYIIKGITEFVFKKWINETNSIFIIVIISIVSGIILGLFIKSDKFNKILKFLRINLTIHSNIFDDIDDKKYGEFMRVHLTDEVIYEGRMRKYENANNFDDIHIMLSEYIKYKNQCDDSIKVIDDLSSDNTAWVVLRAKDIKAIEVFYDERSENTEKISDLKGKEIEELQNEEIEESNRN
ncbi:hypothetical protein FDC49_10460 [Clostridium sporogenes]|uniref:DUF6338 family protein n=1 Tax=Clostridium sporogenes TaxID=1509 RepID=UPI0013D88EE1|nr:DUF6338 family protein [Clostridium sporogenes]NFG96842.1 hypothetical protein [Clostridium sporogenes]NFH33236.1 hypothetical protein [Clostridium sporogenes]NFL20179.1 hypothetical protein [Clostridium sporogenes]NFN71773.1 hypothetical protein [Clostridium sporogenes]NFV21986.1 hypothetical protein [Clostridium sporogenes]